MVSLIAPAGAIAAALSRRKLERLPVAALLTALRLSIAFTASYEKAEREPFRPLALIDQAFYRAVVMVPLAST